MQSLFKVLIPFIVFWSVLSFFEEDKMTADCYPNLLLPQLLLDHHSFFLDQIVEKMGGNQYWAIPSIRFPDHFISMYPPTTGILYTPFYFLMRKSGMELPMRTRDLGLKVAILWVAMSGIFVLLALEATGIPWFASFLLSGIFVFGTGAWSTGAGGLWQHTSGILCLSAFAWLAVKGLERSLFFWLSAFPLSLAAAARPTNILIVFSVIVFLVRYRRSNLFPFLAALTPIAIAIGTYNYIFFKNPFVTGYSGDMGGFTYPFLPGLAGLLFSPSKGLFVVSPFLLAGLFVFKKPDRENAMLIALFRYLIIGCAGIILVYSKWYFWWGGLCYGYRIISDVSPILLIIAAHSFFHLPKSYRSIKYVFVVLALISIMNQAVFYLSNGFFPWHAKFDHENALDTKHYRAHPFPTLLWSIKNSQILFHYRNWWEHRNKRDLFSECHAFHRPLFIRVIQSNYELYHGRDCCINHEVKNIRTPGKLLVRWDGKLKPSISPIKLRLRSDERLKLIVGREKYPPDDKWGIKSVETCEIQVTTPLPIVVAIQDMGGPAFAVLEYWDDAEWKTAPPNLFYTN